MKLAILTLPLHANYGGIMQAYALQTALERLGHSVEVLQRRPGGYNFPLWQLPLFYGKRAIRKYLLGKGGHIRVERYAQHDKEVIEQHTRRFFNHYIHLREVSGLNEIKSGDYQGFIVGSDQIWRPKYIRYLWKSSVADAFLRFAKSWDVRRVAYAPSFGVDEWEFNPNETKECRELIRLFDGVSTREVSGTKLCRLHLNCDADLMPDPTLLLSADDYFKLIGSQTDTHSHPYLFTYILDTSDEIRDMIEQIAQSRNLEVIQGNADVHNPHLPLDQRIQPPLENWLAGIAKADFVITDSFHACVFAIIFGKPFITLGNYERGSARFESLLSQFGLEHHMIFTSHDYNPSADYLPGKHVKTKLASLQLSALSFLERSIGK